MECGFGFGDLVHNYGHFITSILHNFDRALYYKNIKKIDEDIFLISEIFSTLDLLGKMQL